MVIYVMISNILGGEAGRCCRAGTALPSACRRNATDLPLVSTFQWFSLLNRDKVCRSQLRSFSVRQLLRQLLCGTNVSKNLLNPTGFPMGKSGPCVQLCIHEWLLHIHNSNPLSKSDIFRYLHFKIVYQITSFVKSILLCGMELRHSN